MEELKRFLKSINVEYSDEFKDLEIEKVIFNRETKVYTVYLHNPKVLSYDVVTNLFNAGKKGINGVDKCYLEMVYDEVTSQDITDYVQTFMNNIIFEHPSLSGVLGNLKEVR